jgi:hypothetical protein
LPPAPSTAIRIPRARILNSWTRTSSGCLPSICISARRSVAAYAATQREARTRRVGLFSRYSGQCQCLLNIVAPSRLSLLFFAPSSLYASLVLFFLEPLREPPRASSGEPSALTPRKLLFRTLRSASVPASQLGLLAETGGSSRRPARCPSPRCLGFRRSNKPAQALIQGRHQLFKSLLDCNLIDHASITAEHA